MTRRISTGLRLAVVALLSTLLVVSPATAGGLLKRLGCNLKAKPKNDTCCPTEVVTCCPAPVPVCPPACVSDPFIMTETTVYPMVEADEQSTEAPPIPADSSSETPAEPETEAPETEAPETEVVAEPAMPADDAPVDTPTLEEPAVTSPSDALEQAAEEPVVPAAEVPAEEPNLFTEPAAEVPAAVIPETEEPSLFDDPDLFSEPAAEPALVEPSLLDPAPAAETPTPAESFLDEDIFGTPDVPPAPAEEANLFDDLLEGMPAELDAPAADEPAAGGDLFDGLLNPTSTQQEEEDDTSESLFEELFGAIDLGSSLYLAAVERIECEQAEANHLANVSTVIVGPKANVLDSTENRLWIDNTGEFSTEGRVIEITTTHVRLLKENGRTCTVPLDRLSPSDTRYVEQLQEEISPESLIVMAR